jgi:hypothetical protein
MEDDIKFEITSMMISYETQFWRVFWHAKMEHPEVPSLELAKAAVMVTAKHYGPSNEQSAALMRLLERENIWDVED